MHGHIWLERTTSAPRMWRPLLLSMMSSNQIEQFSSDCSLLASYTTMSAPASAHCEPRARSTCHLRGARLASRGCARHAGRWQAAGRPAAAAAIGRHLEWLTISSAASRKIPCPGTSTIISSTFLFDSGASTSYFTSVGTDVML